MTVLCNGSSSLLNNLINDLLKNINDQSGVPLDKALIIKDITPAFLTAVDDSLQVPNDTTTPLISTYRDTGWLAVGQSLYRYVLHHYSTLRTTFLERILLQAQAASPCTKLASCLRLDDSSYNASMDGSDRLAVLLGALDSHAGTSAIDTFLHPHFTQHIFIGKSFQQQPDSSYVVQFENLVNARGGSCDIDYEQLEGGWPVKFCGWNCSITFQLGLNTPYIVHHRKGQTKKQAKLRVLHDIYNYYSRNNATLILHCSAPINHPHFQPQPNISQVDVKTLSIPTDQLYDYDDDQRDLPSLDDLVNQQLTDPKLTRIPADIGKDDDEMISFLTQALLLDFNLEESQQQQQQQPLPTQQPASLVSSLSTSGSERQTHKDGEMTPVPSPITNISSTSPPTMMAGQQTTSQQDPLQISSIIPIASTLPVAPPVTSPIAAPIAAPIAVPVVLPVASSSISSGPELLPISDKEDLLPKAIQLMECLTIKDREQLHYHGDHLRQRPNDSKGYLINLASKIDDGFYYRSTVEQIQLEKSRAYYKATVHFGTDQVRMDLVRTGLKKKLTECNAAMAIYELLDAASKNINARMNLYF